MSELKRSPSGTDVDVENKAGPEIRSIPSGHRGIVEEHEENDLSRSLSQRHIQMIALAGAIVSVKVFHVIQIAHSSRAQGFSSV